MANRPQGMGPHVDADGVRVTRRATWARDAGIVVALGLGLTIVMLAGRAEDRPTVTRPAADVGHAGRVAPPGDARASMSIPPAIPTTQGAKLRALKAMGVTPTKGPEGKRELSAGPVIEALRKAGVTDGIAAFPPPGTDPPKSGIIVPDDWVLPEGYVRHHQATDDGEQLPPILMFHPDYEFEDEHGRKITVPPDRIVPPELAPPGLAIQLLEVPTRVR